MNDFVSVGLGIIGGLGIFLYGIHYMSESLQRIAGARLKRLLATLTKTPIRAAMVGIGVTALIQSSSATTVTVVGFVNAGLMELQQAIGVVMGANVGTTVTAWIIGIKITKFAPLLVGIGAFMVLFIATKKWNRIGQVILGFGFIFFGMIVMKEGVAPLKSHEMTLKFFQSFSQNPFLAILAGIVMTAILQSSSATIGLAIVLAQQELIDFNGAVPLILGDNIGTTVTMQLAALRSSVTARRAAMSHTLFNCLGTLWILPFVVTGLYQKFIIAITPLNLSPMTVGIFIANTHTCFNVVNTVIFLPFVKFFERVSTVLVKDRQDKPKAIFKYLEPHLIDKPAVALEMVRMEAQHMLEVARSGLERAVEGLLDTPPRSVVESVGEIEQLVDELQLEATRYMITLSQQDLSKMESDQIPVWMHTVNDIERISDHAFNVSQAGQRLASHNVVLTEDERKELDLVREDLLMMFHLVAQSLSEGDGEFAQKALEYEKRIDDAKLALRKRHIRRLQEGTTDYFPGMIFMDTINNFEKIGDHLTNIAQAAMRSFHFDSVDLGKHEKKIKDAAAARKKAEAPASE